MKETYPLQWPSGWKRTLLANRIARPAWKKTEHQTIDALELELKRFGILSVTLTRKDPQDFRTAPDPSVAIWFSRKHEDDFSWQEALGISNPSPTADEVNEVYRKLVPRNHTDHGGDLEMFLSLTKHRNNALAYISRLSGQAHEMSIGCDAFKEARWNINAIRNTIHSLRQMERDGTTALLEQTMKAFTAIPERSESRDHATASSF